MNKMKSASWAVDNLHLFCFYLRGWRILKMFKAFFLSAAAVVSSIQPVFAWQASTEGPDVFGVTKVIATEGGPHDSLVVQCDSKETLFVAYVLRKKEFEDVPEAPATLYIQGSGGTPLKLEATMRTWNDNYAGVVAVGRSPELMAAIQEIKNSKAKVNVGYEIGGNQDSASFSSRGSTTAMQRVIDGCRLSDIPLPPA
ncbi:hypothetical protein [Mesorhizobium sp. M0213]|uniref:hypothetical protein n=3 Tax=Mesorhizobium TaxID=68287 RepID=UPI003338FC3C